jgi:type I restriction enzyme S subunit
MSWQKVKLGQFLKNREGRYKPNDKAIQGLKRIDKINFSGTIFLSDKPSNTDMILVKKGDLIISGINVEKGAMNIYQGDENVVATIHYSSYEFDEEKIDIDFLTNFLKSLEFKKALKEQVPGGIKTEIKPKHILPLIVEIPTDVEEQKRVVKKLIEKNSIIENTSSELTYQLSLIKQLRQAFLREAMQGKLVKSLNTKETGKQLLAKIKAEKAQLIAEKKLKKEKDLPLISEEEIPFEIPEHWAWCRLGDVIDLTSGQDLSPSQYSDTRNVGLPYITGASNLQNGEVMVNRWTETPKSYALKGDLLFTCKGSGIGKMAYLQIEKVHIARQIMSIRSPFILLNYIEIILSNNIDDFRLNAKSLIPGIDRPQVFKLLLALPPLHEQEQIVAKLEELKAFCDGLEQSIKESQGYNEKLLQEVLREALQPQTQV